ncbi:hypothetical protein ASF21_00145 [Arthrobacter sp. Leaf234]|uniref:sigma-70 family RNA polymerase sigma factor n=1 Tax=Arthrobacter sp. Leaf234 TaxID=1736303 RepID=UPI0007011AC0|nr:sigma-70 family RNA polymerase sigma factor [Arthrobacter sp. Leaf234]KQO02820.1 hypothetical protein ASF21_00145 [Arthrobacter sp. Leaf234]
MDLLDETSLHDAAYRYAFRRSLSVRLASSAAHEATGHLPPPSPGWPALPAPPVLPDVDDGRDDRRGDVLGDVLVAARSALERFLPPDLPPRVPDDPDLRSALSALRPDEREFLLLRHWDGLEPAEAARATGQAVDQLRIVEDAVARRLAGTEEPHPAEGLPAVGNDRPGPRRGTGGTDGPGAAPDTPLHTARPGPDPLTERLRRADPATTVTEAQLDASRPLPAPRMPPPGPSAGRGVPPAGHDLRERPEQSGSEPRRHDVDDEDGLFTARDTRVGVPRPGVHGARAGRVPTAVGAACLLALVAVLASVIVPRPPSGPSEGVERLYGLADVVAIVSDAAVEPTTVDGDVRILQASVVVQIVKGEADGDVLTVDVTGRSTLERPYSRNFFPPHQLLFLVRDGDGVLSPIEGEGSVLTLVDRRSPEATTVSGDPAPLPPELRDAIDTLPAPELALATSGVEPGGLDPADIVGILPAEGRSAQNLPANQLGTFRMAANGGRACVWFEFNGRSVVLRWPEGFSAYEREEVLSYPDGDPRVGRRVLTVLNERGYPYVDENRPTPYIRGVATGERATCGGKELDVWDIAAGPGSTLLFY